MISFMKAFKSLPPPVENPLGEISDGFCAGELVEAAATVPRFLSVADAVCARLAAIFFVGEDMFARI